MTRVLPILLLAAAATTGMAQEKTHALTCINRSDKSGALEFRYDDKGRLSEFFSWTVADPDLNNIRAFYYDDNNRIIKEELWQDKEYTGSNKKEDFHWNIIISYEYDAQGNLISRRNYNNFESNDDPNFEIGAVMTYIYDENGRRVACEAYWDEERTDFLSKTEYEYDEAGRILKATEYRRDRVTQDLYGALVTNYSYTGDGKIETIGHISHDPETNTDHDAGRQNFAYEVDGSLKSLTLHQNGGIVWRRIYHYLEAGKPAPCNNIAWPINIEDNLESDIYSKFTIAPEKYDFYLTNMQTGALNKFGEYIFEYTDLAGVENITADAIYGGMGIASFNSREIRLNGVLPGDPVRIYDLDGRLLRTELNRDNSIDISTLPAGQYVVSAPQGSVKIAK